MQSNARAGTRVCPFCFERIQYQNSAFSDVSDMLLASKLFFLSRLTE